MPLTFEDENSETLDKEKTKPVTITIENARFMYVEETDIVNSSKQKIYKIVYYKDDEKEIYEYMTSEKAKDFGEELKKVSDNIKRDIK